MNTEIIMSRANELKEFKLKNEIVYIKTDRERDAMLWYLKLTLKIKEGSEAEKEIDSCFDLFTNMFSLNVIIGILFCEYYPGYKDVYKYSDDEIERIILCMVLMEKDETFSVYYYLGISLFLYKDYIEKQKIEKN